MADLPILSEDATQSGQIVKMEVDYSKTCDEKIPLLIQKAKDGDLKGALEGLLVLEKQTRTGMDSMSTARVLIAICEICFDAKDYNALNENITALSKRRSQLKQAVTKMVQHACDYVDEMPDKANKEKLIETLRAVTEGKIYVEVERARLTYKLAKMKEEEGDTKSAATIMQELQVETYGSMEKKEKVEMILEQMRLCIANQDYIRTQIIAKKISVKFFEDESTHELKLKFYRLMIELNENEGKYLDMCKHYRAICNTQVIKDDEAAFSSHLQCVVLYIILAPYDGHQSDLLQIVSEEKGLSDMPTYKKLLELFVKSELISWQDLCSNYEKTLKEGEHCTDVFTSEAYGQSRWKDLKVRVIEHNLRVIAQYYTRITLTRMAELLTLNTAEAEEFLSNLVVKGTIEAKTDRLEGIVSFCQTKDPNDRLNEWSHNLNELMQLVSKTTHLINKEEMVHKHLLAKRSTS